VPRIAARRKPTSWSAAEHCHAEWGEPELVWFEALMDEEDVDIMGWALGTIAVPARWQGPMMERFRQLDYIDVEKMGG
jgi:antitoxin CptB